MGCHSSNMAVAQSLETEAVEFADFHGRYSISEKLGRGSYAQVHLVHRKDTCASGEYAVKVRNLRRPKLGDKRDKKACASSFSEACVWSRVGKHANCVRLFETFFDAHLGYMVMEKCCSSLIDHVVRLPVYSERSLSNVFSQMLEGISHLHSLRIVHQDIKVDNFLVGGRDNRTIKLAGFGLSVVIPEGQKVKRPCGTPPYMSPEILQGREYGLKVDVWSMGVIAHLFLIGKFPYASTDGSCKAMKKAIANGGPPKCTSKYLSKDASSFLLALLERDEESRVSADLALAMPFISGSSKLDCNMKSILYSAVRTGAFDYINTKDESTVDVILNDLQEGIIESKTKRLGGRPINEFFQADAQMTDKLVETFWLDIDPDVKFVEEQPPSRMSSKSTTYSSTGRSANMEMSDSTFSL